METISVTCNHCGAPLTVGQSTRFATCKHCGRQLKIVHGESSTYTEVLEGIAGHTEQIARDTSVIRLQNELEQIDREWASDREQFLVRNKDGSTHVPTIGGTVFGVVVAIAAIIFVIVWGVTASSMGAPAIFPIFAGLMVVIVIVGVVTGLTKASGHNEAEAAYQRRRSETLALLRDAQAGR